MRKNNLLYILIIILLTNCSLLYNSYIASLTGLPYNIEVSKRDFIDFPIKQNEYKIYPLTKEISNSISKNIVGTGQYIFNPNTVVSISDSGDKVKYIQHRLNEYGYKLEEDGSFEAATYDALINFQFRCRIDIDGQIGLKTLELLNLPVSKNKEFSTIKPVISNNKNSTVNIALNNYKSVSQLESSINSLKVTSNTNYYIRVDLKNQRVNIFKLKNGKWILDKSFICSSGNYSSPTIKGNFTIKNKGPMFRAGSNTICKYFTQFSGDYLFHTVLLDNNGTIQDGRLGTPLSHGCIRLAIDDAKYIYTSIPYNTSVSLQ